MRSKHFSLILVSGVLAFALGCKKDEDKPSEAEQQAGKITEPATTSGQPETTETMPETQEVELPPMAAVVTLEVENFDTWRQVFKGDRDARIQAGILGHIIYQDAQDPNRVILNFAIRDEAKFDAFRNSEKLKETMAKAGVKGQPTFEKMIPVAATRADKSDAYGIFVEHEVRNFDEWKKGYDAAESMRAKAGIYAHAVFRSKDNPNLVGVYHEAADLDTLKSFMKDPKIKEAMTKAGVMGEPKTRYLKKDSAYVEY